MKKGLFASILFLASLFTIPFAAPLTRGTLVGTVCIDSGSSTTCPPSPPTFSGLVSSQLTVSVNIQGSDSLNGWEILVKTNPSILNPVSDNLATTVFPPGTNLIVVANCINGMGTGCFSHDGPGIVHVALVAAGALTVAPTTGRLFTITYNIVGNTSGTTIGYQTGCTGTSNDSFCVTIANGSTGTVVPENLQTAFFSNPSTFTISANPSSLTFAQGESATSTITLTSVGGFSGTVTLSTAVSPSLNHAPTASLKASTVVLSSGGTAITKLTVNSMGSTPLGNYTVVLTATSGSQMGTVTIPLTVTAKK